MAQHSSGSVDADHSRNPAEIEGEIAATRARIDRVLGEIEERLAPARLAGEAVDALRGRLGGGSPLPAGSPAGSRNPLAQLVRSHPLPVVMVGVGLVWLALVVARRPAVAPRRAGDVTVVVLLNRLIGVSRNARDAAARAADEMAAPPLVHLLRELAAEHGRVAATLEVEVRRLGGTPLVRAAVHADRGGLAPASERGSRAAVVAAVEVGRLAVLREFRTALGEPLPADLLFMIGAHLPRIERLHNRLGSLEGVV